MDLHAKGHWQPYEDELLCAAVAYEEADSHASTKWSSVANYLPGRTNKECRKRWYSKMASDVAKGGWSPDEDERLLAGMKLYGNRWTLVSSVVQTRNGDQCAKRWGDSLDPGIDRTAWTPEKDQTLIEAVAQHGRIWTKIAKTYFPGRTGLALKNRFNSLIRLKPELVDTVSQSSTSSESQSYFQPTIDVGMDSTLPLTAHEQHRMIADSSGSPYDYNQSFGSDSHSASSHINPNLTVHPFYSGYGHVGTSFDTDSSTYQYRSMHSSSEIPFISHRRMFTPQPQPQPLQSENSSDSTQYLTSQWSLDRQYNPSFGQ